MNYKDQIKDLAMKVNTALTEYVAVHNTIFQEAATLNSLLRNVAGKGVTMSDLLEHSERLVPVWDDIEETMAAFRYVATPHWSNDEKRYFDILSRYASALRKTVDALVDRQRLMYEGSKGGRNNAMTWEAYQEKEKAYQLRIQEYTAIGQELNAAAPIVFDEEIESTISLNAQCASAFLIVAQTVMDDAHWRAFGFKRRPRRGKMFQGFVSASRLERETTLLRELWASSFSAIFRWALDCNEFQYCESFIAKLMEYSIDGLEEPLWPVFRFPTRRDAMDFLRRACSDYATAEGDQQPHVFLKRSKLAMAQQVPKLWLVGAVWLFAHPNSLVRNINSGMTLAGVSKNPDSDIEVNDEEFQLIADELLYNVASGNEP